MHSITLLQQRKVQVLSLCFQCKVYTLSGDQNPASFIVSEFSSLWPLGQISEEEATKHAFMSIFKPADLIFNTEYIECV